MQKGYVCCCNAAVTLRWSRCEVVQRREKSRGEWKRMPTKTSDASAVNQEKILVNQKKILANQLKLATIVKNQTAILKNQSKLDEVLANQRAILKNQKQILGR